MPVAAKCTVAKMILTIIFAIAPHQVFGGNAHLYVRHTKIWLR